MGLLLLKGIAAVAEVPRQEDFGVDAVATLLRNDPDGNCYAEDTFVVQLKSASMDTLIYRDHELEWLISQSLPMFIGRVSLKESSIELYPTIHIHQAVFSLYAKSVTAHFGKSSIPPMFHGHVWSPWAGDTSEGANVWLGPPLLRWSMNDINDDDWSLRTYDTLKRFLSIARRELELIKLNQTSVLRWNTNDPLSIGANVSLMRGVAKAQLQAIANQCIPGLRALMLGSYGLTDAARDQVVAALVVLAGALREDGVEVDEEDLFGKWQYLNAQRFTNDPDSDEKTS